MQDAELFNFREPPVMQDGDLALALYATQNAADSLWSVPAYIFHIRHVPTGATAGRVTFRVTDTDWIVNYTGHIGYRVDEAFRGQRYAEQSCRLLLPFIRMHRPQIWITCAPDNFGSMRTIERLGASFVEVVDVPADYPIGPGIARRKRRYFLQLE
jgi:predicted acetyltransferase